VISHVHGVIAWDEGKVRVSGHINDGLERCVCELLYLEFVVIFDDQTGNIIEGRTARASPQPPPPSFVTEDV
jgi:hypothetical protein